MSRLFLLKRSLIRCNGINNEASDFLQGLITNDMRLFNEQNCIYTLFLNKLGRILNDSIIYKLPVQQNDQQKFLIECDSGIANNLMRHLKLYRVRRKVDISLSDEHNLWCLTKSNVNLTSNVLTYDDPRVKNFGLRIISSKDHKLKSEIDEDVVELNDDDYRTYRYKLGIPEGIVDILPEKSFPHESNCDFMNGVSFHKGCYIGQELTARTHHTGVVRKRLMPIIFEKNVVMTENVDIKNEEKQSVGKLRNVSENYGLGLMRIEPTVAAKSLNYNENPCRTEKPFWWPKST